MKKFLSTLALSLSLVAAARADATVVFNEIHYHPATNEPAFEWIELRNQLAVDVDISEWRISGEVDFRFPSNAIVRGGGFVLVALSPSNMIAVTGSTNVWGPFTNRLSNNGGTLRLRNNSGRVADEMTYGTEGDWPVAPDGSGVTLAKRDRDTASGPGANWTWSDQIGGTPGADNFPLSDATVTDVQLIAPESAWRYEASGTDLGTAWRAPGYNDTGWGAGNAWLYTGGITNSELRALPTLFNSGIGTNGAVLAAGATDPHYTITAAAQGSTGIGAMAMINNAAWLANDLTSSWIGVNNNGANNVNQGVYWYRTGFSTTGFQPGSVNVTMNVSIDNDLTNVFLNGVPLNFTFSGFNAWSPTFTLPPGSLVATNTVEFRTLNAGTSVNPHGFRVTFNGTGQLSLTNTFLPAGPTTYYLRKSFTFSGDPAGAALRLNTILDDGAVFYLNGVEVLRLNMPGGAVSYATPASSNVTAPASTGLMPIPSASLVNGTNVLAVELHQAAGGGSDALFGAELIVTPGVPPPVTLTFNEQSASTNAAFWLELHNYGTNSYPLAGAVLALDGETNAEFTLPAVTVGPGQFLALSNATFGFLPSSGDKIYLYTPGRTRVYDAFVVKKGPRAKSPDGSGTWLHPDAPTAGTNNSFAFRTEIVINEIMYNHRDIPASNNVPAQPSPEAWIELYNRSANPVALTGWELDGGVRYNFAPGKTIPAGGYLVVADDVAHMRALYPAIDVIGNLRGRLSGRRDRIILRDPSGNPADEVEYYDSGRWPDYADGGGSSLELRDAQADNARAEAWAASDETAKTGWQNYSYTSVAAASATSAADAQWRDFVLGMLSAGECLIDDISVIQSPGGSPVQFIANGDFSAGRAGWRFVGNHNRSSVIPEPGNPGNNVLHLVATGPQEHMHNHVEATFTGANAVANGQTYQISFRAKHLAGNNLVNTRLYFNRCARTTALPVAALNGTPGAANSRAVANIGPTFSGFGHARVIPQANEPVTVSVTAADPQGVASCEVRYSVNGGAFATAAMTHQGGGRYTGVIPGQAASAIVQFYVRAVDGLGAEATYPAAGPNSGALYKVNDGQALLSVAHNVRIVMTPANASLMHAPTNVMSNDRLPGTIIVDEKRAYYDAGIRLKSSQRGRNDSARVGFHLEFPPEDPFRGVHPFMLVDRSNVSSPPAEEMLVRHLAIRCGVAMPHPDTCRVIGPFHIGPAIFFPRYEDEFIETAYENGGDGTLFELELTYYPLTADAGGYKIPQPDGVQGVDISNLGTNKETYRYNFMIKNNRGADDFSGWMRFAQSWSTATGPNLEPATRLTTDWDQWTRAYAMVSLFSVNDMYSFGNNHNLIAYQRPGDGRFHYFLWDMDFSLTSGRGATAPLIGDQNVGRIVNNVPSILRCFYGHMLDQIDTYFNSAYMAYWVDRYDDFVPGASYAANLQRIQDRANYARGQISGVGGNAAFNVTGTNLVNNLVTLSGTAPVSMKSIRINGIEYAVTWTSISGWTVRVPVGAGLTALTLVGYDVHDRPLTNFTRVINVNYTGPAPVAPGTVVINEINYNPATPDAAYVELFNSSSNLSFDLSGWRINGLDYTFPDGAVLTNRGLLVLANDPSAYAAAYSNAPAPFGTFGGNLQNDGETLTLLQPGLNPGEEIIVDRVRYEPVPPWPAAANGLGSTLQLIDAAQDNARVANWTDGAGWRYFSFTANPGGAAGQQISFLSSVASDVYLDDLFMARGSVAEAGTNFFANPGFESPLAPYWVVGTTNTTNTHISSDYARSGSNSLRLIFAGNAGLNDFYQRLTNVIPTGITPSTNHTISFWYLPGTNSVQVRARLGSLFQPAVTVVPGRFTPGAATSLAATLAPFPPVWLNEAQPENLAGPFDNNGEREPWVELYNAGTNTVSLAGYYLSPAYNNLAQWAFPSNATLAPGEFKTVICDGEAGETTESEWHASFRLSATNGSVALSWTPNVVQILDYLNYTNLAPGWSYGDFPDGQPFYRQSFYLPTPGGTNDNLSAPLVVYINEWMAANTGTLLNQSNNNRYDDWFEIHNPGATPADLGGYYLSDNLANPLQFQIPAGTVIPPNGFLHVWADGEPGLNLPTDPALHVPFQLSQDGDSIGIFGSDGRVVDTITFGSQNNDIAEGRYPDGPAAQWISPLSIPTPGAPNAIYGNRYPVLAALPVQTVYASQPVSFTAPGGDPDAPPQILAYTMLAGPTNATLHPSSGALLWTPTAAQENTTNTVTIRVSDNGAPVLRATRDYTFIVRTGVLLGGIVNNGNGTISFTVSTTPGKTYRVEYKDDLNAALWTHLPPDQVAAGSSLTINDTIGANPQRFYQVIQLD